ncbi:MAG TPA: coproporphyrinogen-III oxidase family protein [Bryobacteraceae bacterium]|nr:coproporphyrinogen-III oxidase family protein [Bryobacteraceae bacterium]
MSSGAYISWPFCPHKCSFCNFASGVFPQSLHTSYTDALVAELERAVWPSTPDTVYFGGGTPSLMPPKSLERILQAIPGRPWREVTLEALPGRLQQADAEAWLAAGVDRVSFGVQSFVPRELCDTGRRHTPEEVGHDFAVLRNAGFRSLCLDLIAGLPYQTIDSWHRSLDWVERIAPEHVSVYLLEVDEDSRLGREVLRGGHRYGAAAVPPEGLQADLYEIASQRLEAMGLLHYEISNFARPGFASIHNSKYWKLEPYLGFGADAHSFDGTWRWSNIESPVDYVARVQRGDSPECSREMAKLEEERFFLGLRLLDGIKPRPDEARAWDREIADLCERGLLSHADGCLRLTQEGLLLSNEVFQEFVRT